MAIIIRNEELDDKALASLSYDYKQWVYNALDVCVTHEILDEVKSSCDNVTLNTYEFSKSLMAPILEMSLRGTRVDTSQRFTMLNKYQRQHKRLRKHLNRIVLDGVGIDKPDFNYRSPYQLKGLFYGVLGLKPIKARNSHGKYSATVNRDALETLDSYFVARPICSHILQLRNLDKKISLLETKIDADKRMRSNFNIAGTNTGRLSSSVSDFGTGTNTQNIDRYLRSVFIPDQGMKFCNIDLEQADARNVGAIIWNLFVESHGEEYAGAYLNACESGDLHTTVCRMAYTELPWTHNLAADKEIADDKSNYAYREFTYRDMAKRLGHGTNFYGTPRTMAKHLKMPFKPIDLFQQAYFKAFPAIGKHGKFIGKNNWHSHILKSLEDSSQLTTMFGRRRTFYGRADDARTLRAAIAYEPQSMTADEIDTGLIRLWRENICQLLIQVHDSILFQYPAHLEDEIIPRALELLSIKFDLAHGREFTVPVEAKIGWNWGDGNKENPSGLLKWQGVGEDNRRAPSHNREETTILSGILKSKL